MQRKELNLESQEANLISTRYTFKQISEVSKWIEILFEVKVKCPYHLAVLNALAISWTVSRIFLAAIALCHHWIHISPRLTIYIEFAFSK